MAKRRRDTVEEFAEDLGKLLGTATAKAENWLDQRKQIAARLTEIRDTASRLLTDLGHQGESAVQRGQRAVRRAAHDVSAEVTSQRRKMSAKARKAISDAQKKRWAEHRAKEKK